MRLAEVQAVIDSAKAVGMEPLERFIRWRLPEATPAEIADAASLATEIIEAVPIFLARAAQEASERHLSMVVQPLLDHAQYYFLRPTDLMPEATQGLAGLLDDAYLVLRVLQNLEKGPEPFLDWDLDYPAAFIRRLVGEQVGHRLDVLSLAAMQELSDKLSQFWSQVAHEA